MPEKSAEKSAEKITDTILSFMELNKWYRTVDFEHILDVKERRIKILLQELVDKWYDKREKV